MPVLKISDDATSEDRSSVLVIADVKFCWHPRPVSAGESEIFSLGREDVDNTDQTESENIPALPEV